MSDPQRFDCLSDGMWQNSAGDYVLHSDYARLKDEVERLRKAVMHSPAAQLKLKELEGKTTYEEINPKENENNS